ncbi:MAG: GntR family transcriptional regulator [Clostridiales bacterium]|jgi:K+/H+ antiporter YhaU regulatory subunit KhtT|nr:GntR family transcriptional regulator [Clostridiales bacterium]
MRNNPTPPVYSRVALDIATKIARGEMKEGQKISGRSLTSSEYGVSPETVRRAFRLLSEMEILDIQKNSGAVVLSKKQAMAYIQKFESKKDMVLLRKKLSELLNERNRLNDQILESINEIININERFRTSDPLRSYEYAIPENSPIIGKTIADSKFWQNTGATIVALRRGDDIILSPGPYAVFMPNDSVIVSGEIDISDRIINLINPPQESASSGGQG